MSYTLDHHQVLVIDDDSFQLDLISHQLISAGVDPDRIEVCLRGGEALARLKGTNTGGLLILLDLAMPEIDGVQFVRELVDIEFSGALILVSGEEIRILKAAESLARAHRLNVLGFLDKPVQPGALGTMLTCWHTQAGLKARHAPKTYTPEAIKQAIHGGELFNLYQPQVEMASGTVTGVEALVRWYHPVDGVVFPDQFIAIAEEAELIDDLTNAVLAAALDQSKKWQDEALPLRVSINISMDNLTNLDFPNFVLSEIARSGAATSNIILEVTESRLMKDSLVSLDILTRLQLHRIGLSIDDFGTGHSSLAQLRDIPFNELKIDRSFVHGAATNSTLRGIVEASLTMAANLGMRVVAEGIEDRQDWEFLRERGCDLAQGYYIAKPMPAANIPGWLAQWETRRQELVPL